MPQCPHCGTAVGGTEEFCPACGRPVADAERTDQSGRAAPEEHTSPPENAPAGDASPQSGTSRRRLLKLGAGGVAAAGLAGAGWTMLGGGDGADGETADAAGGTLASLTDWIPAPGAVGRDGAPFAFVDATAVNDAVGRLPSRVYPFFEQLGVQVGSYALPFTGPVLLAPDRTRVFFGSFDADRLRSELDGLDARQREYGGFDVYASGDVAYATDGRRLVVGRRTVASTALEGVRSVVDARRGRVPRYVDAHGGAASLVDALGGSEYVLAHPASGPTDPEHATGYGVGVRFEGARTRVANAQVFDGSPQPAALEDCPPTETIPDGSTPVGTPSVTTRGDAALAVMTVPTGSLPLFALASGCASVSAGDPGGQTTDDAYELTVRALQFVYEFVTDDGTRTSGEVDLRVDVGRPVRFRATSWDVIHGIDVRGTPIDELLFPGQTRSFTHAFDEPGEHRVRCSWYCGAGHEAMEATLTVVDPDARERADYGGWLDGVSNYDGPVDRQGESTVTVRVGAAGNGGPFAFDPPAVVVDPGTTVRWEWTGKGGSHSVVEEGGDYESDLYSSPGVHFEHTFDSTGVSKYFCRPHRPLGMKGAVDVR